MNRYIIVVFVFVALQWAGAKEMINGVVQDRATRHTLAGANVFFSKSGTGVISDSHGRFSMPPSEMENDTLIIRYMGYESARIAANVISAGTHYIELERKVLVLNELRVESDRYKDETVALSLEPGALRMNLSDIRTVPYTLQPDINNALQFLPGVITMNELTNELNVRGGNPDQNLVLLEGVPVYYPFHLFGLASAFNTDLVGEVHFSPGGFSARYGNRLSSVLNVKAHSPQKKLEISSDLSIIGADLTASGRIGNKLEWIVSGRKSYVETLFKNLGDGVPYGFYDVFGKIAYTPHPRHTISLMGFKFRDKYSKHDKNDHTIYNNENLEEHEYYSYYTEHYNRYSWQNTLASVKWDYRVTDRLNVSTQLYTSVAGNSYEYENELDIPDDVPDWAQEELQQAKDDFIYQKEEVANDLTDHSINMQMDWDVSKAWRLTAGALKSTFKPEYGWGSNYLPVSPLWDYNEQIGIYFDQAPTDAFAYTNSANMYTGFAEALWQPKIPLTVRGGLRLTRWQGNSKVIPEPRLNAKYQINPNWSVTGAYGRYTQGLATALEDGLVGFLRLYFPLNDSLQQENATHWIANVEYAKDNTQISLTSYYKQYSNLVRSVGPGPDFIQQPGTAYGVELFLKTKLMGWQSWFAATVGRTYRTIAGVKTDTNWDQRYRFDTYFSRPLGKGWKFSGSFVIYSGVPYYADEYVSAYRRIPWSSNWTDMEQDYYDVIYIDVPPGKIRHPWYHRLDVSLEKEFHFSTWHMSFYAGIRNLYARKNVLFYEDYGTLSYDTRNGKYVDYYVKHPYTSMPPIPTVGIRVVY